MNEWMNECVYSPWKLFPEALLCVLCARCWHTICYQQLNFVFCLLRHVTWRSNDSDLFHVTEALNESVKFCLASGFLLAVASFMLNTYHINCLATRYGSRTRSYPLIDTLLCTSTLNVFIRDSVIQFVCDFLDLIRCTIPDTKSNSRVHKNAVFSKAMRFTAIYSLWRRI